MADLLSPALFDRLLWATLGATGAALLMAVFREPRRRRRAATHQQAGEWHQSPGGASTARDMAKVAMATWQRNYGPMSARQAVMFAAVILSSDNVSGWTDEFEAIRLNVIGLARRVVAAHQQHSNGQNGAGGAR